ncbi:MAG: hypothetical protein DME37_03820 [Verrucomicrobia bacterium]|nr:MAG: hypothetical protein DME37_03820 [Verrucomicrobiota bacterium]
MKIYYRSNQTIMKIYSYSKSILGVIFAAALLIAVAHAQTSSVTTGSELESTGTITEYTPGSALVLDIGTGEPVQFKLSQNIVYADPDGTVLEAPGLSKNLRIRVYYIEVGGDNVVDKVTLLENY